MSATLQRFKDELANRFLVPIEDRIREIWPKSVPLVTLVIRTPWLADGGIVISNDSLDSAVKEIERLLTKGTVS